MTDQDLATATSLSKNGRVSAIAKQLPQWLLYAVIAACVLFMLFVAYQAYSFLSDFNDAVDILSGRYGINSWLAKAIALIFVGPLAWGLKRSIFGSWSMRVGTSVYACAYFLGMYLISQNASFSHKSGEILQWYAETPDGVRFFDSPGYDPKYGIELKPVTSELKIAMERRKLGQTPGDVSLTSFNSLQLFDPLTSAPKYWFSVSPAGVFSIYDGPGFDPKNQTPLQPITPAVAENIRQSLASQAQRVALQDEKNRGKREAQLESLRVTALQSLFDCSAQGPIALAINPASRSTATETTTDVAEQLAHTGKTSSVSMATNFFRPKFFSDGYFERAYAGDVQFLQEAGAFTCISSIVLAQLESSCGQVVSGVTTCDLRMNYRVFDHSGRALDSGSVSASGAGFDKNEALQNGAKTLAETKSSQIIRSIKVR